MSEEKPLKTEIKNDLELSFTIAIDVFEYHVDFHIYEIVEYENEENVSWQDKTKGYSPAPVQTLEEAELFMHGSVKWDGCSNWKFDIDDDVMLHCCDREDLERIGKVLANCWDLTKELCPNWSD